MAIGKANTMDTANLARQMALEQARQQTAVTPPPGRGAALEEAGRRQAPENDGRGQEIATRRREVTGAGQQAAPRQETAPGRQLQAPGPPAEVAAPVMDLAAPPVSGPPPSPAAPPAAGPAPVASAPVASAPVERTAEATEQPQEPPPAERREERAVNQVIARQAAQQYTNASLQAQISRNQLDETV